MLSSKNFSTYDQLSCVARSWDNYDAVARSFKKYSKDYVCITDSSEIFIERPENITMRAQTQSNYTDNNTLKYLIGIIPGRAISFLSLGWGGRGDQVFFNKVSVGHCILTGFNTKHELCAHALENEKKQLSGGKVDTSRQLSSVTIHVKRVIGRITKFKLLRTILLLPQADLLDEIMVVVRGLVNINISVVSF